MVLRFFYKVYNLITNLYFLMFLNGFLLASILYFKSESTYEKEVFGAIAHYVTRDSVGKYNSDTFFIRALQLANSFEHNRLDVFGGSKIRGVKAQVLRPSTMDLLVGNGACGSASVILSRILKSFNYQVRFAQMVVNGKYGGHIIIEAYDGKKWIVLDPLYNLYFKDSLGHYSSFKEVQNNFNYYKKMLPQDYKLEYAFEGVRYTNWGKVKIIGPLVKRTLDFLLGKETADEICIRSYLVRIYHVLYTLLLFLFIPIFLFTVWKFWHTKVKQV